jgi:hypothetical protein
MAAKLHFCHVAAPSKTVIRPARRRHVAAGKLANPILPVALRAVFLRPFYTRMRFCARIQESARKMTGMSFSRHDVFSGAIQQSKLSEAGLNDFRSGLKHP